MEGPTRFGDYLLFKKLSEDPLGETYRAGALAGRAVERIVLLRAFDGAGIDPPSLIAGMERHRHYGGGFHGPGLTYPIATGEVHGVPFSAYEYVPGRDLASLAEKANSGFSSLATQHAALVAERMAKGLAVVHQAEAGAAQPFHGFLVPQLVHVSSEGETRLTGFEVGTVLAAMVATGQLGGDLRRYLAPEVASGNDNPSSRGDIYSLGAIFWELLTGEPLRPDATRSLDTHLARATLVEGGPLPDGLANLLRQSLAAPEHRISRADVWHRQLVAWMDDAGLRVTNFDLAFFVNELYREDIKKEGEEVAAESGYEITRRTPTVAPPSTAAGDTTASRPGGVAFAAASKRPPVGLWIGLAALLLLAVGLGVFLARQQRAQQADLVAAPPPSSPPAALAAPPPVAFDLESATAELDRLMAERTAAVGARLADDYDDQIRSLSEQLEEARRVESELAAESRRPASPLPPPVASETIEPVIDAAGDGNGSSEPAPRPTAAPPPPATAPPPPATAAASSPAVAEPTVPPELLQVPRPEYPAQARRQRKEAVVLVKVLVDEKGRVHLAQPVSSDRVGLGFDEAALRAAEKATYRPGTVGGQPRAMWTTLVVRFDL